MDEMDRSRAFVKDVKRIVVKVGTAVVTRKDGRLALGRVGALCEQIKELNSQGYEVIMVSSGAVGLGRQRLRYRKLVNSSFADLQKPQVEIDGKACAAVGQNSLMALYDTLFSQLDLTSAQLLVTDHDFMDKDFRRQMNDTVKSLLSLKVIPVFNENDAVSTRKAPYEDSSGIFWDNDSLAALLALDLKADLLVLLSDVEGLYSGPPSDPRSKLIHTYVKEKHQSEITFGDKSRVGRGGMTAKVKAAVNAADAGIPVVITSGYAAENIIKVLQGQRIGTLFHHDAHLWGPLKDISSHQMAVAARESSRKLQALSSQDRKKILLDIADALEANEKVISVENEADVAAAQQAGYEKSLIARLLLRPRKISGLAKSIRVLANMEDPIGQVLKKTQLADGLILEKTSSPLGVLLVVFESRPDALVQIASLAIRSGNGLLLKGGKEAKRSNAILHKVITEAIPDSVGGKLIGLVTSREEIPDLLKLDDVIDLVIPRGSNKLVSQIKNSTKIPVLGHADGICHVYVDKSANMAMAKQIVLDAKVDYPAACNAMETLLVHKDLMHSRGFDELIVDLRVEGVTIFGGPRASSVLNIPEARKFHHEYNSMACTVELVDDVYAAIDHIHQHGSAHTDCIIAEDKETVEVFLRQVDSAAVFHNASTRFCDGARFGLGAEVGISTGRIHARGPVGVEGLLTTRWILRGSGHVVAGDKELVYTHKNLPIEPLSLTNELESLCLENHSHN
ncbi:delta-1-pyrroline-5-carboxylate synthase isoform X1 [Ziziphus jujuba]|uniref:Delta-1-pyrroline-5-carboxylate synthase n=1 Tax=Ziziphus jujuba TaxID=326968 RepID=A0A6P3ZMR3_ZIZJJ|nr:delta-1-pyrroline-5-carboxylate synthase isoform X1 [Ziziphus jujuba]